MGSVIHRMGEFVNKHRVKVLGYTMGTLISSLNICLLWHTIGPVWVSAAVAVAFVFAGYVKYVHKGKPAEAAA